ncbi:MAG TPA: cation transporter dimerization domain-containing protein [Bryobacteraceae bacterium]|nr:cation transporter dimerization domain-containing protein [Bryobacteraceae bacterium]
MSRRGGTAYVFMRWGGSAFSTDRLGDVGWAFEQRDRLDRFNAFVCGAVELIRNGEGASLRTAWHEKCPTLADLVKAMSHRGPDRPGFDEVKVFEVKDADPDAALVWGSRPFEDRVSKDSLSDVCEMLTRYGVRTVLGGARFAAPFLWYNMLPGRSVPVRKLPVHLFQMRLSETETPAPLSVQEIEDRARQAVGSIEQISDVGECFVTRVGGSLLVGLTIIVDGDLRVRGTRQITDRANAAVRAISPQIRHVFIQTEAED